MSPETDTEAPAARPRGLRPMGTPQRLGDPRPPRLTDLDRQIGQQLRARRRAAGLTQQQLAMAAGVTYQQVQKYEAALNRVSAATLYLFAHRLRCEVGDFLPSREGEPGVDPLALVHAGAIRAKPGGERLLKWAAQLAPRDLALVLRLMKGMVPHGRR